MLIIEKKTDIRTLKSLGACNKLIRKIFIVEGWLISILGMISGIAAGILFVLAQSHLGFIKMPGSFMATAYPVILKLSDILITMLAVAIIGYIIALLPTRLLKNNS